MLFVHNKFKIIISTSFMLCQPRINFLFLQAILIWSNTLYLYISMKHYNLERHLGEAMNGRDCRKWHTIVLMGEEVAE